jgi:phage regulator Rha-like protein
MDVVRIENIEEKIIIIDNNKVILDIDVANLYGVETKRINEAVKNNIDKFPKGYFMDLSKDQWDLLKSKFSTSNKGGKNKLPKAFTEKGLYMLATILKSKVATQTTIAIIETFSKIRELTSAINQLSTNPAKEKQQSLMKKSGEIISELLDNDLQTNESETTIEINFAVMKFKHTVKKSSKPKN